MTTRSDLDRSLAAWFHADAAEAMPDYLGEIVERVSREPQRRWWSSPERWLPVDVTRRANSFALPPMGRLLLVGLLILAIAALAIVAAGSLTRRVPPPFGPARNGEIAYWGDGDIYVADPDGGNGRVVIGGPTRDFAPLHSHDGTQLIFWREPTAGQDQLMIAAADGSGVRQLTDSLLHADWFEWSPHDDQIAVVHTQTGTGKRVLSIVDATGSAPMHTLDVPFGVDNNVYWLPPDGAELVFSGRPDPDSFGGGGLYAVRPDGSGLRTIGPVLAGEHPYFDIAPTADGTSLLYSTIDSDDSNNGVGWHIHQREPGHGSGSADHVRSHLDRRTRPRLLTRRDEGAPVDRGANGGWGGDRKRSRRRRARGREQSCAAGWGAVSDRDPDGLRVLARWNDRPPELHRRLDESVRSGDRGAQDHGGVDRQLRQLAAAGSLIHSCSVAAGCPRGTSRPFRACANGEMMERSTGVALPSLVSAATSAAPPPRGTDAARARGAGAEGRS